MTMKLCLEKNEGTRMKERKRPCEVFEKVERCAYIVDLHCVINDSDRFSISPVFTYVQ